MADLDLEARIDQLYRTPLEAFIAARKELGNDLKKAGKKDAAARVQALPKPNAVAYVLNRFFGERRGELDGILRAGQRVREAFRATMSAAPGAAQDLTKAQRAQRETIVELVAVLRAFGESIATPLQGASVARLEETLLFISTTGRFGDGPPGRLIRELEPPGLEVLADMEEPAPLGAVSAAAAKSVRAAPPAPASPPPATQIQASSVVANANEHVDEKVALREAEAAAKRAAEEAEREALARAEQERERKRALAALDKELRQLDEADDKLAKEMAPFRERASAARSLLHSCQTEHASLVAARDELKTRIVRMEAEIARIDRAMAESEREIKAAEVPIAAADERGRGLKARRAELEAQRAALLPD